MMKYAIPPFEQVSIAIIATIGFPFVGSIVSGETIALMPSKWEQIQTAIRHFSS